MNKKNKRLCDACRKHFYKSELVSNPRGQFCRKCYEIEFPDGPRVKKWKEK